MSRIGEADFGEALVDSFQAIQPFEHAVVIAFDEADHDPSCLAARHSKSEAEQAMDSFLDHHFELFRTIVGERNLPARQPILDWYKKDNDNNSSYIEELYQRPGISHELALLDEVDGIFFYLGLFRSDHRQPFLPNEAQKIADFWPLALSCIIKHARISQMYHPWDKGNDRLESLTKCFLQYDLSQREAEICGYIISGYSAVAMSLMMNISLNTVSTLRQRAYRKLNITSHSELYGLYIKKMRANFHKTSVDWKMFDRTSSVQN